MTRFEKAYQEGVFAHRLGHSDENPYGVSMMLEMCAFSGGYFDSMRGLA